MGPPCRIIVPLAHLTLLLKAVILVNCSQAGRRCVRVDALRSWLELFSTAKSREFLHLSHLVPHWVPAAVWVEKEGHIEATVGLVSWGV